jgi:protein tyrosine/serine phosphatase
LRDRTLVWDGCLNVRDLGGHPTEDGATTRFGAVVRADSVRRLSDEGWREVVEYEIATIVDLRFHSELEADPPRDLPVAVVHVPLFPEPGSPVWPEIDAIARAAPSNPAVTGAFYLELLERFGGRFAEAVSAVAEAPPGGVLVHCTAGKDRTGLVAALLLRLAGVGLTEVGADYAVTERNLAPATRLWVDEAEDEVERARRVQMSLTPAEAMVATVEELERRHGSVVDYLRAGEATAAALERARARLRD